MQVLVPPGPDLVTKCQMLDHLDVTGKKSLWPKLLLFVLLWQDLGYLKTLPSNDQLSLKQISIKALFLLIMSCISRVSSVARLGPDLLVNKVTY